MSDVTGDGFYMEGLARIIAHHLPRVGRARATELAQGIHLDFVSDGWPFLLVASPDKDKRRVGDLKRAARDIATAWDALSLHAQMEMDDAFRRTDVCLAKYLRDDARKPLGLGIYALLRGAEVVQAIPDRKVRERLSEGMNPGKATVRRIVLYNSCANVWLQNVERRGHAAARKRPSSSNVAFKAFAQEVFNAFKALGFEGDVEAAYRAWRNFMDRNAENRG